MQRLMLLAVYGLQALARDFAKLQIMSQQAVPRCVDSRCLPLVIDPYGLQHMPIVVCFAAGKLSL